MKIKALFSGSFDPITSGHIDIVRRASKLFDEVYVTAFLNSEKYSFFSLPQRKSIIEAGISDIKNAFADMSEKTVSEYVKDNGIDVIVKGIRSPLDCQYEIEIAGVNENLCGAETIMIASGAEFSRISSTIVREMLKYNLPIENYVTKECEKKIFEFSTKNS